MQTRMTQKGISFWGLIVVAGVTIFFILMFFKLLPPYIEHAKVKTALENMTQQPNAINMEKSEIKAALQRRLDIDDVNDVDLSKSLFVEKKPGATRCGYFGVSRCPGRWRTCAAIPAPANAADS